MVVFDGVFDDDRALAFALSELRTTKTQLTVSILGTVLVLLVLCYQYMHPSGILVLLLLIFMVYNRYKPFYVPGLIHIPVSKKWSFLGSLLYVNEYWEILPDMIKHFDQKFKRAYYVPVPNIGLLGGALYSLVSEANIQHVLKDNFENYEKGGNFKAALEEFLGNGIFTADGNQWKHHRKVASNMFSRNLMRHGTAIAIKQVKKVVTKLERHLSSNASSDPVDIQDIFFRMTIDVFASIAFGVELDSTLGENQHPFAIAFDEVQNLSQKRFKDPFWRISRFFQSTQAEKRIRSSVKVIDNFASEVIRGRRRDASNGENIGPDLLSRFLDTKDPNLIPAEAELRDIVMNFMIAGRDTTACALSWTMYELAKHPDVTERIIEEVNRVCNDSSSHETKERTGKNANTSGRPRSFSDLEHSFENISNLTYTHAVVMEVLRLHPSVPVDIKFAKHDDTLPDGTPVLAGSSVLYSPYAMGRSTEIWGDDAADFRPKRFLGTHEPSAFKYPAFNAGYRLCLGKSLAFLEIKLTLSLLLPKFHFEFADGGHAGGYHSTLVLPMKPSLCLLVRERSLGGGSGQLQ